jgi:hypothetical protein
MLVTINNRPLAQIEEVKRCEAVRREFLAGVYPELTPT